MSEDWRSGAYGANQMAHLFDWHSGGGRKATVCGARLQEDTTRRVTHRKPRRCSECLRRVAAIEPQP